MLREYHRVWLAKHPERSEGWLLQKLKEGFDIHHADHNHENNNPGNLVLIEHGDHMALHNSWRIRPVVEPDPERAELARLAYEAKETSLSWLDVEERLGMVNRTKRPGFVAHIEAGQHARLHGLPWPKPGASLAGGSNKRLKRPLQNLK